MGQSILFSGVAHDNIPNHGLCISLLIDTSLVGVVRDISSAVHFKSCVFRWKVVYMCSCMYTLVGMQGCIIARQGRVVYSHQERQSYSSVWPELTKAFKFSFHVDFVIVDGEWQYICCESALVLL